MQSFFGWHAFHKLECGTWYHHPRRLQCVLNRNLRIFKVATWHYRCFQLNNHPIRPPNSASGDLGNWKWNWMMVAVVTELFFTFQFLFHLDNPKIDSVMAVQVPMSPSKPVMLTFDLQSRKCYSLRSSFGMYNLERQLWYLHLLTRHCPCNLLPEPTSPKDEYRGKIWGHSVTSSMTLSQWNFFLHNLGRSFHIWGRIEAVINIWKFSKWPPFWARDKLFYRMLYRKLNIPER